MTRRKWVTITLVLVVGIASICAAALSHAKGSDAASKLQQTNSSTKVAAPPLPPISSTDSLASETTDPEMAHLVLDPPDANYQPALSAAEAEQQAWTTYPPDGGAQSATVTLAVVSWPPSIPDATPVWLVTWSGSCVPSLGSYTESKTPCFNVAERDIISAKDGSWLGMYSDGSLGK